MPSAVTRLEEVRRRGLRLLVPPAGSPGAGAVAFTDRDGGVSAPPFHTLNLAARVGDERTSVLRNRERVASAVGFDPSRLRLARQVHGADTIETTSRDPQVVGEADVLVTRELDLTVGILTADCSPVVLVGVDVVAIAHAGWRGLVAGAVEAALAAIEDVRAAFVGPSIRACCYEVGPEVVSAFEERGLPVAASDRVDPAVAASAIIRRHGVEDVAVAEDCTSCDPRYFSYRRDGVTGRQGAFVTRRG